MIAPAFSRLKTAHPIGRGLATQTLDKDACTAMQDIYTACARGQCGLPWVDENQIISKLAPKVIAMNEIEHYDGGFVRGDSVQVALPPIQHVKQQGVVASSEMICVHL